MTTATGFFDQSLDFPPSWIALIEKLLRWYDNQIYPVWCPFFTHKTRSAKQRNIDRSMLDTVQALWAAEDQATKDAWGDAADFVKRSGYQLYTKDVCYRLKNDLAVPGTPSSLWQSHGLKMSNPGGATNVRLQRDDVILTGQVTTGFSYKKVERNPTASVPFKFVATLWYLEDGEIKTESHTWTAPAGNVAWASVSETYGTADRVYFHHRVLFYLDSYDADVYFDNFLIQDKTRTWTVEYDGTTLPEDASPAWSKTGDISTIEVIGSRLHLEEVADSANSVKWSQTPTFYNAIGSTVKARLMVLSSDNKDSGLSNYCFLLTHSDGTHQVRVAFYSNGVRVWVNGENYPFHIDTSVARNYRTSIQGTRFRFYIGTTEKLRVELDSSGGQEVSFALYGRSDYRSEVWLSYLKYYHGADEVPGQDILREAWWLKSGEVWEPDTLYRKSGWYFYPEYHVPYFDVVYLD